MERLNRFYIDSFAKKVDLFNKHLDDGYQVGHSISYGITDGIIGKIAYDFLAGKLQRNDETQLRDENGAIMDTIDTKDRIAARAHVISLGLGTDLIPLSRRLLGRKDSSDTKFSLIASLNLGYSWSMLEFDFHRDNASATSTSADFRSTGTSLSASLQPEYTLLSGQHTRFSLGLRAGYRFLKTETLRDPFGEKYKVSLISSPSQEKREINLDFSGLQLGGFIKFSVDLGVD